MNELSYGAQDGFGRYGILDHDDDGRPVCHDCGRAVGHLATHARLTHGYATADDYRDAHGLSGKVPLVSRQASERMSAAWERNRSWREPLLAEVRLPVIPQPAQHRLRVGSRVGRTTAKPSRPVTAAEVESLGDWWDTPEWCRRAHELIARTGVSQAAIAAAVGRPASTVQQRLRRSKPD